MIELHYKTADGIQSYNDSVRLAIESRTDLTVKSVQKEGRLMEIVLSNSPSNTELNEIDDILSATERKRVGINDAELVYELQETDNDDPNLPDDHLNFEDRVKQLVGNGGPLGKDKGNVPPTDVKPDIPVNTIVINLPDTADDVAMERLDNAMLAFGKVPTDLPNG